MTPPFIVSSKWQSHLEEFLRSSLVELKLSRPLLA